MGHEHHEHDHEDMHAHGIEHTHDHEHTHEHEHSHEHCDPKACAGCAGCADPKAELAGLAKQLQAMGDNTAYEQVMAAVSDFEKGNMRLSAVLAAMNVSK